eukprot:scaffold64_cov338-Pavlova_lutheri.AAC.47
MHPPPPGGSSPSMDWFLLGASVRVGKALASNQPFGSPVVIPGIQLGDPSKLTWTCSGKRSRPSRHNHARAARSSASSRRRRAQVKDVRWRYDRQTTYGKGWKGSSAFPTLLGPRWTTPSRVGFFVDASHAPSRVRSAPVESP